MADSVTITNLPDSGSPERVALDLCKMVLHGSIKGDNHAAVYSKGNILATYAECRQAVRGGAYDISNLV
ncbi:hypothetical protein [Rhizorhabdus histidinilytica]|uniref:Uncharacterized protein n=1 Tax=Rhizorhabdus histidinilytica TaxID=439228 RepID=A0A1T5CII4_9SPHN|nr:hypothetical protein [Rhizorhabdus histidinilytica]SKB58950.1 hypothetical protein SAMN06295920_10470 [Rhizorhabdus histidinilytica]